MNKEQAIETLKGYLPEYLMKYGSVDVNTSLQQRARNVL